MVDGVIQLGHLNDFDADFLARFIVDALVNGAAIALPNVFVESICIPLNSFHRILSLISE